jgi:hypothetical protein
MKLRHVLATFLGVIPSPVLNYPNIPWYAFNNNGYWTHNEKLAMGFGITQSQNLLSQKIYC